MMQSEYTVALPKTAINLHLEDPTKHDPANDMNGIMQAHAAQDCPYVIGG